MALLVDSRGSFPDDMMKVSAVTVTGRASQVEPGADFEPWAGLLTARHPYLRDFVQAPSTALFRVDVVRYLHVTRFQEVRQWIPASQWVIPLAQAADCDERWIGGKAAKLARLAWAGFRIPDGFVITTHAYEHWVERHDLARRIRMELGRKPFASMRWEEIWDLALRIRSAFLAAPIPPTLVQAIVAAVEVLGAGKPLAVRSSAPGEDSAQRSFAGLHESVVGVVGAEAVLDAARVVWASLWSDAALLYRQELALDPGLSRMAVIVQEMIDENRSGVAFGRDPRDPNRNHAIVEAVPGPCGDLVDGLVDPDRWILDRSSGDVVRVAAWGAGGGRSRANPGAW